MSELPRRDPAPFRRGAVILSVVHAVAAVFFLVPGYLSPDSVAVYAWLRSIVFDRDLVFFNEWSGMKLVVDGVTMFKEITPVGALANHWWVGTSMLSAPAYLVAHGLAAIGPSTPNGMSGIYAFVLAWTTVAFGTVASIIALRTARCGDAAGQNRMLLALALVWAGSPLVYYEFRLPLGTHLAGALAVAAGCWYLIRAADDDDGVAAFIAGLWLGLAVAARLQHVVLAPAVLAYLVMRRRPRLLLYATGGSLLPIAVQGLAWLAVYGHPLGPLVSGASHAGSTWMPFTRSAMGAVLVSSWHGLFSWSPLLVAAVAGWIVSLRGARRAEAWLFLLMFAGEWVANGFFDRYFWGGLSFGGRRFIDLAAPFAVGVYWCLLRWPRATVVLGAPAAAWNLALAAAATVGTLDLSRDLAPADLFTAVRAVELRSLADALAAAPSLGVPGARLSAAAFAIVAATTAVAAIAIRRRRAHAFVVTAFVVLCAVTVAAVIPRTWRTAVEWQRLTGIDVARSSRVGPLLDERSLLTREWEHLRRTNRLDEARKTENDLAAVERALSGDSR